MLNFTQNQNNKTRTTKTEYNQPKIILTHIKRIKINKQIK